MKFYPKMIVTLGLFASALPVHANDQAKIAFAKKVILAGEISPYATPTLKNTLQKAHKINDRMAGTEEYGDVGCEFAEHFYLGHGNSGLEANEIINWKAKVLPNGSVRITFGRKNYAESNLVEMDMQTKGKTYVLDDVRFAYSDNPKKVPTGADSSIKLEAQAMINKNGCTFDASM